MTSPDGYSSTAVTVNSKDNVDENIETFEPPLPFLTIKSDEFISVFEIGRTGWNITAWDRRLPYTRLSWNLIASTILMGVRKQHAGKKKFASLAIYLELPCDLILEIFGYLHPIDLYHLGQTSKALRRIVMTNNGLSLWKVAFENLPRLPPCPPGVSEPHWVALLFGPDICGVCRRYGALVDFTFLRRFCTFCMRQNCIALKDVDHSVGELVPNSDRSSGTSFPTLSSYNGHLWCMRQDVLSMTETIKKFQADIERGKPGAEQAFENFKQHIIKGNVQRSSHAKLCMHWATDLYSEMRTEACKKREDITDRIQARLVRRGHLLCDIENHIETLAARELLPKPKLRLTRRVCRHILPRLEAQVNEQKIIRLERERETLLGARVLFIRKIYDEYRRTSPPKSWAHLPPFHRILHSEPFWSLYNVASNVPLDTAMCADAVSQLPAIISRWTNDLRDRLESLVPVTPIFPSPDNPPVVSNLELATSVFICRGWHTDCDNHEFCLIGWDDVRNHVRCSRMFRFKNDELVASNIGRHAASSVIQSLDLDPQKVTAKELDEHDARFLCADCPIIGFRRVTRHEVYTWRECISHVMQHKKKGHSWRVLAPQAGKFVRMREQSLIAFDKSWSCSHCGTHLDNYVTREEAIAHVKETHSIENPTVKEDVFYYAGTDIKHTPRKPVILDPLAEYACNQCPSFCSRLFNMGALKSHLRDKHKILDSVVEKDYVKIELIA